MDELLATLAPHGEVEVDAQGRTASLTWRDGVSEEEVLGDLRRVLGAELGSSSRLMHLEVGFPAGWRVTLSRSPSPVALALDAVAGLVLEGCRRCEGVDDGPLPRPWAPGTSHGGTLARREDLRHLRAALGPGRVRELQEAAEVLSACSPGWVGQPSYAEVTAHLESCRERLCEVGHLEGLLVLTEAVGGIGDDLRAQAVEVPHSTPSDLEKW